MDKTKRTLLVKRWRDLRDRRSKLDYEWAAFAADVREAFPAGASGDQQMRAFCIRYLDAASSTASMLLRAAKAFNVYDEPSWTKLGGWRSVQFIEAIDGKNRTKVRKRCLAMARKARHGSLQYDAVRNITFGLGIRPSGGPGRPTRSRVEEDYAFLRSWLIHLYDAYDLPPMPEEVQRAMRGSRLSTIREAFEE